MLHDIDTTGMISWHCHSMPECPYHNCQGWDREDTCPFHANQFNEPVGKTHTAHLSDPAVRFKTPELIELPACPECGEIMILRVHSEEELIEPIITRDEITGKILQAAPHPSPKYYHNLWFKDVDVIRKRQPHPTLAHLTPDQIEQMQADIKNKAPDAPVDWMMTETMEHDIHHVYQHPAVARHRELADQLIANGKEYGVITSPRIEAIKPST